MVYGGIKRVKALFFNFLSAIFAVVGGVVGFFAAEKIGDSVIFLLPFAAGNFIYIASSDLIPEIKHRESLKKSLLHFFVFLLGIGAMWLLKLAAGE
jgi:zinc and cadmium transporter